MDQADIRTSVNVVGFLAGRKCRRVEVLLHVPRVSVQEFQIESGTRIIDCEIGAAA